MAFPDLGRVDLERVDKPLKRRWTHTGALALTVGLVYLRLWKPKSWGIGRTGHGAFQAGGAVQQDGGQWSRRGVVICGSCWSWYRFGAAWTQTFFWRLSYRCTVEFMYLDYLMYLVNWALLYVRIEGFICIKLFFSLDSVIGYCSCFSRGFNLL